MRLIDADALKNEKYPFPCAIGVEYAVSIRAINDAPTIDPYDLQPHGHWIIHHSGGLICSHCNHYIASDWRSLCCPICGARLDGEVEYDG